MYCPFLKILLKFMDYPLQMVTLSNEEEHGCADTAGLLNQHVQSLMYQVDVLHVSKHNLII